MKKLIYSFVVGLFLLSLLPSVSFAYVGLCCAKCGGNMPLNILGAGVPETKELRFKVSPMFMHMEGLSDGTKDQKRADLLKMPPDGKNSFMAVQSEMDMTMLNLAMGYSFSDDFFGGLMLMWQDKSMPMRFNQKMTTMTKQSGFTMESEGLADTMLMSKYRLFTDDPLIPTRQMSFLFSLSLPTGSIDEKNDRHPLGASHPSGINRQKELLPYGMQLGSGTLDPTIGLLYQGSGSPYWWGANATYTARLYENKRDYRLGDEFKVDLYGMYQFRYDSLVQVQLNSSFNGKIRGEMDEFSSGESGHLKQGNIGDDYMTPLWDPDNYGGTKIKASFGLQWQPVHLHIIEATVSVPLLQDLNGPQLEEKYSFMLTWYRELPTKASVRHRKVKKPSELGF